MATPIHLDIVCVCLLVTMTVLNSCNKWCGLRIWKYLLTGSLWETLVWPCVSPRGLIMLMQEGGLALVIPKCETAALPIFLEFSESGQWTSFIRIPKTFACPGICIEQAIQEVLSSIHPSSLNSSNGTSPRQPSGWYLICNISRQSFLYS